MGKNTPPIQISPLSLNEPSVIFPIRGIILATYWYPVCESYLMYYENIIEDLIQNELRGLCTNCALAEHCAYRKATKKVIVQCELYQLNDGSDDSKSFAIHAGLCINCDKVKSCELPGKNTGIWHCEEYE